MHSEEVSQGYLSLSSCLSFMNASLEAVNQAREATEDALSDHNVLRCLCNCRGPGRLIEELPLEQRVLTQNFRPTRVALEHWKALTSAAQQGIPEEPCIPGSRKRYSTPLEVYDGLSVRQRQLECAATSSDGPGSPASILAGDSSSDDSAHDSAEEDDVSDEGILYMFSDDFRRTRCTHDHVVGNYAREAPLPPSMEWLEARQPGNDGRRVYKGQAARRQKPLSEPSCASTIHSNKLPCCFSQLNSGVHCCKSTHF